MPSKSVFIKVPAILFLLVALSILAFMKFENLSASDALWLTVITMATVGYGDYVPHTMAGRATAMFIVIGGVGLYTYALSSIFTGLLEGQLAELWWRKRMMKKISKLENHIILCGAGRVGKEVAHGLLKGKVNFVVIESDPARLDDLREMGVQYVAGDATEDKVLDAVHLESASGLIITLPDDTSNLFITITSKSLNPDLKVITRANRPENINKMVRAGADQVICPSAIAGARMALSALKPTSVSYVETLVDSKEVNIELEEIVLGSDSPLADVKLKDSSLREKYNVLLLAIKRDEDILLNPSPDESLKDGDILIVCGSAENLARLEIEVLNH
ncbi:MAG: NAD-binding protein [Actinobacteria bacterium]|nr:NAD-binding protein [Actinomycetota bacterium]